MISKECLKKMKESSSTIEIFEILKREPEVDMLDLVEKEGIRENMDTIGNLIDKLVTVNCKMWHNQEILYEIRRMTSKEFEEKYAKDLTYLHRIIARACSLNVQRAQLMDEVDAMVVDAIKNKRIEDLQQLMRPQEKMY